MDIAANINAVTRDGVKCTTLTECRDRIRAGEDIDYDGVTGELAFSNAGEPSIGSYGSLEFGPENKLNTNGLHRRRQLLRFRARRRSCHCGTTGAETCQVSRLPASVPRYSSMTFGSRIRLRPVSV